MTIAEWIARRSLQAPPALTQQMLTALARDADADEARTAECCLAAASRVLEVILADGRFARAHALELLVVDALTTLAFEHASVSVVDDQELSALAQRSAAALGQLTAQRV